jgi:hypothetical protein
VSQHLQLCRLYVRRLHRSVIEDTPDMDKNSKRSSYILDNAGEGPSGEKGNVSDQRLSAFLRSDHGSRQHSPQNSQGSNQSREAPGRPSFMTLHTDSPQDDSSPGQNSAGDNQPRREDLRASAEKILYTYLLPGSEREIIIPQSILHDVQEAIEGPDQRSDPELFDAAKDYVFQAMERDAFPGFLQSKGLGNLVPQSMMIRLIVGLISFFGAVWTAFILIFLNESRATRCWVGRQLLELGCELHVLINIGHTALHNRPLLHLHSSIHARSHPGYDWLQRIHADGFQPHTGAVRQEDAQCAISHHVGAVCARRHSCVLPLHLRPR